MTLYKYTTFTDVLNAYKSGELDKKKYPISVDIIEGKVVIYDDENKEYRYLYVNNIPDFVSEILSYFKLPFKLY